MPMKRNFTFHSSATPTEYCVMMLDSLSLPGISGNSTHHQWSVNHRVPGRVFPLFPDSSTLRAVWLNTSCFSQQQQARQAIAYSHIIFQYKTRLYGSFIRVDPGQLMKFHQL
jgi:hypothetical protein